jgi:hypothetical protein
MTDIVVILENVRGCVVAAGTADPEVLRKETGRLITLSLPIEEEVHQTI